jgi:hypothetical protein
MRYYVVLSTVYVTQAQLNASRELKISHAKTNADGTKSILEIAGDGPPFPPAFDSCTIHTSEEIAAILLEAEWQN